MGKHIIKHESARGNITPNDVCTGIQMNGWLMDKHTLKHDS